MRGDNATESKEEEADSYVPSLTPVRMLALQARDEIILYTEMGVPLMVINKDDPAYTELVLWE